MSSNLPVGVHVTGDLSVFEHLTRALRRWRRRCRWRGWRTGTASQQHCKESQRQHAFPKTFHRTTRDKWKSNSRDRTDHGRPDHSFFIAEPPASASESAVSGECGCRFCVGIRAGCQTEIRFATQTAIASRLAPTVELSTSSKGLVGRQAAIAGKPAPTVELSANRMSVSSTAALDLDSPAPSAG